jgi:hypothetical protein
MAKDVNELSARNKGTQAAGGPETRAAEPFEKTEL